ncbi:unnamed protein product, partial [Urochloa humidicola]
TTLFSSLIFSSLLLALLIFPSPSSLPGLISNQSSLCSLQAIKCASRGTAARKGGRERASRGRRNPTPAQAAVGQAAHSGDERATGIGWMAAEALQPAAGFGLPTIDRVFFFA